MRNHQEPTQERPTATPRQEDFAEQLAAEYGRSAIKVEGNGNAFITGLTEDIEREAWDIHPSDPELDERIF